MEWNENFDGLKDALKELGRIRLTRVVNNSADVNEYILHGQCKLIESDIGTHLYCSWINGSNWRTSPVVGWKRDDKTSDVIVRTFNSVYRVEET